MIVETIAYETMLGAESLFQPNQIVFAESVVLVEHSDLEYAAFVTKYLSRAERDDARVVNGFGAWLRLWCM
jgi:hypothetical protein